MTDRNRTIDEIIEIVQNMEWGVMTNDIDGKELLKKLNALKNIDAQAHVSSSFICDECYNKITAGMLCEPCSSVGQIMEDGGVCRTHNICNDCCRCREYDSK